MPAKSKSQRIAAAIAEHHPEQAEGAAKEMAKIMSKKQLHDFAKTPEKGLPEKVEKKASMALLRGVQEGYMAKTAASLKEKSMRGIGLGLLPGGAGLRKAVEQGAEITDEERRKAAEEVALKDLGQATKTGLETGVKGVNRLVDVLNEYMGPTAIGAGAGAALGAGGALTLDKLRGLPLSARKALIYAALGAPLGAAAGAGVKALSEKFASFTDPVTRTQHPVKKGSKADEQEFPGDRKETAHLRAIGDRLREQEALEKRKPSIEQQYAKDVAKLPKEKPESSAKEQALSGARALWAQEKMVDAGETPRSVEFKEEAAALTPPTTPAQKPAETDTAPIRTEHVRPPESDTWLDTLKKYGPATGIGAVVGGATGATLGATVGKNKGKRRALILGLLGALAGGGVGAGAAVLSPSLRA